MHRDCELVARDHGDVEVSADTGVLRISGHDNEEGQSHGRPQLHGDRQCSLIVAERMTGDLYTVNLLSTALSFARSFVYIRKQRT